METDILYFLFKNHELLRRLNESEVNELYAISHFKRTKKDDVIYSHTEEIDKIHLLIQGRIKIASSIEKKIEIISEILTEDDIFGELTLKKSANKHREFAQVLSDEALVCSFSLNDFENVLHKNAKLAIAFSQMNAEKLKIVSGKYCDLVFKDVRTRVLNFFILHAQYEGKWTGNKAEIDMFCTHQDIANFTASSRQTVSTIINELVKEKKIIYEGRSKVIIPDINKLEA